MNNWVIDSCPLGFLDKSDLYWTNINDIKNNQKAYKKKFLIEFDQLLDEIKNNYTNKHLIFVYILTISLLFNF